jgi:hypothetical protein
MKGNKDPIFESKNGYSRERGSLRISGAKPGHLRGTFE